MFWWITTLFLYCGCGYALVHLTGLSRGNAVVDIALSWFLGTTWYVLLSMVVVLAGGLPPSLPLTLSLLALPVLLLLPRRKFLWIGVRQSFCGLALCKWWPQRHRWSWLLPVVLTVFVLVLVILHGKNTPTNTDDAVRLRALTPLLVWAEMLDDKNLHLIVKNGVFTSFVPQPGWQMAGMADHFHVNYMILTTALFFFVFIYAFCCSVGKPEQGILSVFLLTTIPLYMYHLTTTYSDAVYSTFFAGALLSLTCYAQSRDVFHARLFLLFSILTASVKSEGEIISLTAIAVFVAVVAIHAVRFRSRLFPEFTNISLVYLVFFGIKNFLSPNEVIQFFLKKLNGHFDVIVQGRSASALPLAADTSVTTYFPAANTQFWASMFTSGNFGVIFFMLVVSILLYVKKLWTRSLAWPFAVLIILLGEIFISSVLTNPQWTVDQSKIHRAIMILAVGSAILLGFFLADEENAETNKTKEVIETP